MILDALILSQFLRTLAVLLHASRHSLAFLRVLAPEALEVALTLGTRPVSAVVSDDEAVKEKEASVLASALELVLVVLDASFDLDSGRALALEKTLVVLAVRDWAGEVFRRLEDSGASDGGQGERDGDAVDRVRRAAAGVLLKVQDLMEKWQRSMISL